MKNLSSIVAALVFAAAGPSICVADGMQDQVDQAATIIEKFKEMPEKGIPDAVLRDAKGLAILTVLKAGFIFSGQGGWGVVVARTSHGWSGPSAIGTGGAGFGFQIGAEVTEFVIVLNTPEAVNAFAHGANITIGADLAAAAGPVGRDLAAGVMPVAAVYTYSRSQGLFAGVSLQGTILAARDGANEKYYGREVTPKEILSGSVQPPAGARTLLGALDTHLHARGVKWRRNTQRVQILEAKIDDQTMRQPTTVSFARHRVDVAASTLRSTVPLPMIGLCPLSGGLAQALLDKTT